jgi:hypothetical protein
MDLPLTGSCQCGLIHYKVTEKPIVTVVCHCIDCQKLSASAFSLMPDANVWTKRAQPWVNIPSDIPSYDGQPEVGELLKDIAQCKQQDDGSVRVN